MPLYVYSYDFGSCPENRANIIKGLRCIEADSDDHFLLRLLQTDTEFAREVVLYAHSKELYTEDIGELVKFLKDNPCDDFAYVPVESLRD
jgi:hypothetical protein